VIAGRRYDDEAMTDDPQPQNIYDDETFFSGYTQLDRFNHPFGHAMEHGTFIEMMGDVAGFRVLDLGCGGGQLASYVAERGAASVTAIDASERMLTVAKERWAHPRVDYRQLAIEDAAFADGAFDLVVSSLAFHYVADYEALIAGIARWLTPGGRLVFSTEHPIYAARSTDEGWVAGAGWAIDDYAVEGGREREWFVTGVRRYHRMLSTLLNGLMDAGLRIERVEESWPTEAWLQTHPEHAEELRRPMFLLVQAEKPRPDSL
jgi:SAM-dependent methyltransferase